MGRSKLPAKVKELRGTKRKDRPQDDGDWSATAVVSLESVNAPKGMSSEAKKIYKERVQMLFAMKLLQPVDVDALTLYSNAMATALKVQKALDEEGYTIVEKDEDGNVCRVVPNPLTKVLKEAITTVNMFGSQFGFSPLSRMKLKAMANPEKEKDNFSEFD